MVRTLATLVFIAGVGGGAAYFSQRKTVIKGSVMAADLLEQLKERGITEMTCDDAPIEKHGAVIRCRVAANDGSRATIEYTMSRDGAINGTQVPDATDAAPTETPRPPRDPNADPWSQ